MWFHVLLAGFKKRGTEGHCMKVSMGQELFQFAFHQRKLGPLAIPSVREGDKCNITVQSKKKGIDLGVPLEASEVGPITPIQICK